MRAIVFLTLVLLLSGCLSARAPVGESLCQHGVTGIFLKVRQYGGNAPAEHSVKDYFLERSGQLYHFRGGYQGESGSGEVDTSGAQLHFIEPEDVKPQLQRAGFYQSNKDFRVSVAWKVPLEQADISMLCDQAGKEFYALEPEYSDAKVADCGWTEINANTQRGDKTVRGACDAAPAAFDDFKAAFLNAADRARTSRNIPE